MRQVETALKHEHSAQTVREPSGWGEHVMDGRMISGGGTDQREKRAASGKLRDKT